MNLKQRLRAAYGKVPDPFYFDGDMNYIRAYYDYRRDNELDEFLIDEVTWYDLDLDRLFKRINPKRCTSGEQYLYYMLRSPAVDAKRYAERKQLIEYAQAEPERRLRAESILARLGCSRRADLCRAFSPTRHGLGLLLVYLLFVIALIGAGVYAALGSGIERFYPLFGALLCNSYIHEFGKRRSQRDYDTVNYVVNMIFAVRRLRKLHDPTLDEQMQPAYESLNRLQAVIRTGGVSTGMDSNGLQDAICTVTLLDLITYEFLKNKLGRCHDDVFTIHEYLGRLDAAISIASYRASLDAYAEPVLHFAPEKKRFVNGLALLHPMLDEPVANDCVAERPILITGSNASGKSTYLKTVALAALMAQSICTVLAERYEATAFRIYSSMALQDDLLAGESYYIVETKSLKRILDAAEEASPILCVVDEVLRGTNTVERIAASSEVLRAMADDGLLCLAATHDIELCELLQDRFDLYHFEEQVGENEMLFDYVIRAGKATSRNAINLLQLIGFDRQIVDRAHQSANRYLETGEWRA
ncbi:MAG: hypothetical protein IIY94_01680 [Oscillospiraceae bacterium]|nr:hypothetical protein [Oscillospiraceae bacterium]